MRAHGKAKSEPYTRSGQERMCKNKKREYTRLSQNILDHGSLESIEVFPKVIKTEAEDILNDES